MHSVFRSLGRIRGKAARRGRRRSWFSSRRVEAALERLEDRTLLSAGALDPTFGLDGIVITDFLGSNTDVGSAVAFQADGKIVVAGSTRERSNAEDFVVTRYNADGTLDTGFGAGGSVVPTFWEPADTTPRAASQSTPRAEFSSRAIPARTSPSCGI